MKTQSFEQFLMEVHCQENPQILDDDLSDKFDDWLSKIEIDRLIKLGDLYGKSQFNEGIKRGSEVSLDAIKLTNLTPNKEK